MGPWTWEYRTVPLDSPDSAESPATFPVGHPRTRTSVDTGIIIDGNQRLHLADRKERVSFTDYNTRSKQMGPDVVPLFALNLNSGRRLGLQSCKPLVQLRKCFRVGRVDGSTGIGTGIGTGGGIGGGEGAHRLVPRPQSIARLDLETRQQ